MWSFGCILVELYTGYPLFAGDSEKDQLMCILEVLGSPSPYIIKSGERWHKFFDSKLNPLPFINKKGKERKVSTKDIKKILPQCAEFNDLVMRCLEYDP